MSTKPSLYPDTNILSYLHYQGGQFMALAKQRRTRDWWDLERKNFRLVTSERTEDELADGVFLAQKAALAAVRRMAFLANNSKVERCSDLLWDKGIVPKTQIGDAIQLAFTIIYRIDYLLTWNYTHLANPDVQRNLNVLTQKNGWRAPIIVSPETIPWASMGQEIRRKDGP